MLSKLKKPDVENKQPNNQLTVPSQSGTVAQKKQSRSLTTLQSVEVPQRYKSESFEIATGQIAVTSRQLENYGHSLYSQNVVSLQWTDWNLLLKGYSDFYQTNECMNFIKQNRFGVTIGTILKNGSILDVYEEIRQRLLKLSLLNNTPYNNNQEMKLWIPLLNEGDFEIIDNFRWFAHNNEIKAKFQYIHKICELMTINTQLSYEKFQKFGVTPEVHLVNNNNKGSLKKITSIQETSTTSTVTVIKGNTNYDLHNIKDRLVMKHAAHTAFHKEFESQKEALLKKLKLNVDIFTSFSSSMKNIYPNKIQAYLICEIMINKALYISQFYAKHKEDPFFGRVFPEILHTTYVLVQFVELLLPYAIEITKQCEIDLENNHDLQGLRSIKELLLKQMREEYQTYEQYAAIYGAESRLTKKELNTHSKDKATDNTISCEETSDTEESEAETIEEQSIIELSLEEKLMMERTKAENKLIAQEKKAQREAETKTRKLIREEKKVLKEHSDMQIKSQNAKSMVSQHKAAEAEKEQKELKERLNAQIKIHDLPTQDFVQQVMIPSLRGDILIQFEMVFGILNNNNTMNDKEILNLACHLAYILFDNGVGCAVDLVNEVKARIHKCHSSDTGDLLPKNYVEILRTCFVLFGIFPKGWEPQTEKDIKTLIKYNNRVIAKLWSESKFF